MNQLNVRFVFLFFLTILNYSCTNNISIQNTSVSIQEVQLFNSDGNKLGKQEKYLVLKIKTDQNLKEYTKAMVQFRGNVILLNGNDFLEIGIATMETDSNNLISLEIGNDFKKVNSTRQYTVFFFRKLELDYDGSYKINLLKDNYDRIEFNVSYRVYSGPELMTSKTIVITRKEFLKLYKLQNSVLDRPISVFVR